MKFFYLAICVVAAGAIGFSLLGFMQDRILDKNIVAYDRAHGTSLHSTYLTESDAGFFGDYLGIEYNKLEAAEKEEKAIVAIIRAASKKKALGYVVVFPVIVLIGYILLIMYSRYHKKKMKHHLFARAK